MENNIDLYHVELSPPSMVVVCTLGFLNISYTDRVVDMLKREHKGERYLKINPDGAVPAIKDGDFCLQVGIAICRYIVESKNLDTPFFPLKDARTMSQINTMLQVASEDYRSKTGPLYLYTVTGPSFLGYRDPTEEEKEKYLQLAYTGYDMLEKILNKSDGKYVVGDSVTLADFYFFIFTMMIVETTSAEISDYIKLSEWYDDIKQIPVVARVMQRRARTFMLAMFLVNWILPLMCKCKRFRKAKEP